MKFSLKSSFVLAVTVLAALAVHAEMGQKILQASVVTTNTSVGVVKGEICSIGVVIPAAFTANVTVASSEGTTVFSQSAMTAGTNWFNVRVPLHSTAGVALNSLYPVYSGTNSANLIAVQTNALFGALAVVGNVTATFVSSVGTTGTCTVLIDYIK